MSRRLRRQPWSPTNHVELRESAFSRTPADGNSRRVTKRRVAASKTSLRWIAVAEAGGVRLSGFVVVEDHVVGGVRIRGFEFEFVVLIEHLGTLILLHFVLVGIIQRKAFVWDWH